MDTPRAGHRDTSMDTPKTGVATKEMTVKNRIPWWNELISKGKSEHELKIEEYWQTRPNDMPQGTVSIASMARRHMAVVRLTR